MDDDHKIQQLLGTMLKKFRFKITTAYNGKESLQKYEHFFNQNQKFAFIVMDLTILGEVGGQETLKKIISFDPTVKAIVSSGYSVDPVIEQFKEYGFIASLAKPYTLRELDDILKKIFQTN